MSRALPAELLAIAELARSNELAILVDLDGTLIRFARTPAEARLDDAACLVLRELDGTGARVVVVSGRPRDAIEPLRSLVPGAEWVAEHGACRFADGGWLGPAGPAPELASLATAWSPLAARTAGAWIEAKSVSLCFHWREVPERERDALAGEVELIATEWLESEPEYERLPAVFALEIRRRGVHKGTAVSWLRSRRPGARILALGDDVTDEDAFKVLGSSDVTVKVGHADTAAVNRLQDTDAVAQWLQRLAEKLADH